MKTILILSSILLGLYFLIIHTPLSFVYSYFIQPNRQIKGEIHLETYEGLRYFIYLPPFYDERRHEPYDLLYHLHGAMPFSWKLSKGMIKKDISIIAEKLEQEVLNGNSVAHIIVAPYDGDGMSMWSDSFDGKVTAESDLFDILMPRIENEYNVTRSREKTTIQGFSMGGFGALKIALKFMHKFGRVISLDGAIHTWETLSSKRPSIKTSIFKDETRFTQNSPWAIVEDNATRLQNANLKIVLVEAWVKDYNQHFRDHLDNLKVEFDYIETNEPHDVYRILNHKKLHSLYHRSTVIQD